MEVNDFISSQLNPQINLFALSYSEMGVNILVAMLLGFIISYLYRTTHRGLSYSQSFTLTILFVTVIVAVVMMVIGGSLARAFALVGALSIIRFRTPIKEPELTRTRLPGPIRCSIVNGELLSISRCMLRRLPSNCT